MGRKGGFCPYLYSPFSTSSHIDSNILTDKLKNCRNKYTIKYISSYFKISLIYQEYAWFFQTNYTLVYAWYTKGPSSLTWLYQLPKTWHVFGIHIGTQINKFLCNCQFLMYIWHTSPQTGHSKCRWGFFVDGTLTDVCMVYDIYHRYTGNKMWMTVNDCAGMCQVYDIYQTYTPLSRS